MGTDYRLDVKKSVDLFVRNFESLVYLPFIADSEMERLYGPEVIQALADLDNYNRQEKICQTCAQRCCLLVDCEFYAPDLGTCPVQSFRPTLCRMHFCHRFSPAYRELVKDLGDIFLEGLLAGGKVDSQKADLFDSPPLGPLMPSLSPVISTLLEEVRSGRLEKIEAWKRIEFEIEHYYTGRSAKCDNELWRIRAF